MLNRNKKHISVIVLLILLGFTSALVFGNYLGKYYFLYPGLNSDVIRANLPTYYLIFDNVAEGGSFWSWKMGIGTSIFSHADVLGDPFTYLIFLLGRGGIPSMLLFSLIAKVFAEGLCFYGYLSAFELDHKARIAAAVAYAFCGYSLIMGSNLALGTILVYAPLVLWGIEKFVKNGNWKLLLGSLFAVCIYSYYYYYSIGILSAVYLVVRSVQQNRKWLANLFRLAGLGIFAALLSAFILFPQLELVLNSPRVNESADTVFELKLLKPNIAAFLTAVVRAIGNDVLGNGVITSYLGNNFNGADYFQESTYTSALIYILLWYYLRCGKNKKNILLWIGIASLGMMIPGFSFVMNFFSTINTRWMYAISILECVVMGFALDLMLKEDTINLRVLLEGIVLTILVYLLGSAVTLYFAGKSLYSIENFKNVYTSYILQNKSFIWHSLLVIGLFVLISMVYSVQKKRSRFVLANICCVFVAFLIIWNIAFNYDTWLSIKECEKAYCVTEEAPYEDTSSEIIRELRAADTSQYRIHKNFDSVYDALGIASENNPMVQNYFGITSYNSLNNAQYIEFLQTMGIYVCLPQSRDWYVASGYTPDMVTGAQLNYIPGVENDDSMYDYLGVKYLLAKTVPDTLNSNWNSIYQREDITVLENTDVFPIAFINGKEMSLDRFLELGFEDRRAAILEYTILDSVPENEGEQAGEYGRDNCQILSFSEDKIELSVNNTYDSNKTLSFSVPYDQNWNVFVDGEKADTKKVNISLLGADIEPGSHTVVLQYIPNAFIMGCVVSFVSFLLGAVCIFGYKKLTAIIGFPDFNGACIFFARGISTMFEFKKVIRMNSQNSRKYIKFYLYCILMCIAVYYTVCIMFRGRGIAAVYIGDIHDTFMDYFNSLANANIDPYQDGFSNYPAMACIIYKLLMHIVPNSLREIGSFELRNLQYALVVFIIYNIVILWMVSAVIDNRSAALGNTRYILGLVILLCAPMTFTLERGNLILLSFALSLFFAFHHDSENRFIRELSFIALAVAAAIKIYPAILGMILVKKKRFKDAVRLAIYGLIAFIVPFFYYDGFHSLAIMIKALATTSNLTAEIGYGYNVGLYNMCETVGLIFGWHMSAVVIYAICFGFWAALVIGFFILKKKWQEWLCLCLMIVLIPKTNYYYIMIFLLIPFVEWLNDCSEKGITYQFGNWKYALLFALFLIPLPLWCVRMFAEYKFFVSYSMLLYYLGIIFICTLLFSDTIKQCFEGNKIAYIIGTTGEIIVAMLLLACLAATLI